MSQQEKGFAKDDFCPKWLSIFLLKTKRYELHWICKYSNFNLFHKASSKHVNLRRKPYLLTYCIQYIWSAFDNYINKISLLLLKIFHQPLVKSGLSFSQAKLKRNKLNWMKQPVPNFKFWNTHSMLPQV